jgi:hypothetical protein
MFVHPYERAIVPEDRVKLDEQFQQLVALLFDSRQFGANVYDFAFFTFNIGNGFHGWGQFSSIWLVL